MLHRLTLLDIVEEEDSAEIPFVVVDCSTVLQSTARFCRSRTEDPFCGLLDFVDLLLELGRVIPRRDPLVGDDEPSGGVIDLELVGGEFP